MKVTESLATAVNRTINRGHELVDFVLKAAREKERESLSLHRLAGGDCFLRLGWHDDQVSFHAAMMSEDEPGVTGFLALEVPRSQVVDDDSAGGLAIAAAQELFDGAIFDELNQEQRSIWLAKKATGGASVTQVRWCADHIELRCGFQFTDGRAPVSLLTITKPRVPEALAQG